MSTKKERPIYKSQKIFFREAYRRGVHGWPTEEPTKDVVKFLKRIRQKGKKQNALDLGCGEGRHSIVMAKLGFKTYAIDMEPLAIKRAKRFASEKGVEGKIKFMTGNALSLKFPEKFFDVALDSGCFHHVVESDWPFYFKNLTRILKDRGYFILTCFSKGFQHYPGDKPKRKWRLHRNHYDRFFTREDIKYALKKYFDIKMIIKDRFKDNGATKEFYHVLSRKCRNS